MFLLVLTSFSSAWYDADYTYHYPIIVSNPIGNQTNQPVKLNITGMNCTNDNKTDLLIVRANTTELPYTLMTHYKVNTTYALFLINSTDESNGDNYSAYCGATGKNNADDRYMPVFDEFENGLDQHRWKSISNNHITEVVGGELHLQSVGSAEELVYNSTLGYYNYSNGVDERPFYLGWRQRNPTLGNTRTMFTPTGGTDLSCSVIYWSGAGRRHFYVGGWLYDVGAYTNQRRFKIHGKANGYPDLYMDGPLVYTSFSS